MDKNISILEKLTHDSSYELPQNELPKLINFMLNHIGDSNPYIRDSLVYAGFCQLILNEQISVDQIISILKTCLDDQHLYFNIDQQTKTDSVFTRSFSALVIDLILFKDIEKRILPKDLILEALEKSSKYLDFETDYRGFVNDKGWAHSVAHGSDLLTRVILHPFSEEIIEISNCLNTLKKCLSTDYAYIDDEHERMLPVIEALIEKGLSDNDLKLWLIDLHNINVSDGLKKYRLEWNINKFTLILYIYLLKNSKCNETLEWINSTKIINRLESGKLNV